MKNIIIISLALITGLGACKKSDPGNAPTATINVISPTANATYHHGDTIRINALATYALDLHGYDWELKNSTDNSIIASNDMHLHGTTISIDEYWVNTLSVSVNALLTITVDIDDEGNTQSTEVPILLQP